MCLFPLTLTEHANTQKLELLHYFYSLTVLYTEGYCIEFNY